MKIKLLLLTILLSISVRVNCVNSTESNGTNSENKNPNRQGDLSEFNFNQQQQQQPKNFAPNFGPPPHHFHHQNLNLNFDHQGSYSNQNEQYVNHNQEQYMSHNRNPSNMNHFNYEQIESNTEMSYETTPHPGGIDMSNGLVFNLNPVDIGIMNKNLNLNKLLNLNHLNKLTKSRSKFYTGIKTYLLTAKGNPLGILKLPTSLPAIKLNSDKKPKSKLIVWKFFKPKMNKNNHHNNVEPYQHGMVQKPMIFELPKPVHPPLEPVFKPIYHFIEEEEDEIEPVKVQPIKMQDGLPVYQEPVLKPQNSEENPGADYYENVDPNESARHMNQNNHGIRQNNNQNYNPSEEKTASSGVQSFFLRNPYPEKYMYENRENKFVSGFHSEENSGSSRNNIGSKNRVKSTLWSAGWIPKDKDGWQSGIKPEFEPDERMIKFTLKDVIPKPTPGPTNYHQIMAKKLENGESVEGYETTETISNTNIENYSDMSNERVEVKSEESKESEEKYLIPFNNNAHGNGHIQSNFNANNEDNEKIIESVDGEESDFERIIRTSNQNHPNHQNNNNNNKLKQWPSKKVINLTAINVETTTDLSRIPKEK